jgi:ABC-2 type transport system permease protein
MFRAVWTKTLWEFRGAILGWGVGLGILIWLHFPLYTSLSSEAKNATFQYAQTFRFYGEPVALTTPGGYATWHTLGFVPVILDIWAVLAGARLVRGEEERGALDILLATPQGRLRLLGEKLIGLFLALSLICSLFALGAVIGEASTPGVSVDSVGAILGGLNIGLTALVFGMLALVLSQLFVHRAAAAGIAGAVMVFTYLLNGTGRVVEGGAWMQCLSPLYYYELNKPLIPSYGTNEGALLVLLALGIGLALVSIPYASS